MQEADRRSRLRPEIQALRAVAVVAVVVFHVWPQALPGGYVGVDIFFAISGFLITSHLLRELETTGRIALPAFWARRVRRLFPSAATVLIVCMVLVFFAVPPALVQRTVQEIAASAFAGENWILAINSVDYLGASNTPTIVQHYWSLGVEEQFYVVWPIILLVVALLSRRRKWVIITVLAIGFAISFIYCVRTVGVPSSYFNTGARAWQFALGGMLAISGLHVPRRWHLPRLVSLIGYGLIAYSVVLFTEATPFPGWHAMIPTLGAVLVIFADAPSRLEDSFPVQFVGDISYPIYLWHWPLVVVLPYLTGAASVSFRVGAVLIGVTVLLAWLTTKFVEQPLRFRKSRKRVAFSLAAAVSVVLLVVALTTNGIFASQEAKAGERIDQAPTQCLGAAAMVDTSCKDPYAVTATVDTAFAANDRGSLAQACTALGTVVRTCAFGDLENPQHTVAVIGNSHAGQLMGAFDAYGAEHGIRFELMRKTGCTGAITVPVTSDTGTHQGCFLWTRHVMEKILGDPSYDAVVFASNDDSLHYVGPKNATATQQAQIVTNMQRTFTRLEKAGRAVVVFGDTPGPYARPVPECIWAQHGRYDACEVPASEGVEHDNLVAQAAHGDDEVVYAPLSPYFCDTDGCHVVIGGLVAFFDDNHMTNSYSRTLAPYLGPVVEKAIASVS